MIRLLLAIVFILVFPMSVMCSPFIVCDPQAGVTFYKITGDSFWTGNVVAQEDGSIKTDVGTISVGMHNINVAACLTDPNFGEVCSATAPFAFTRPGVSSVPSRLRIVP